ncbi:hypothetical protein [Microtetraspora niveoalba]|uniref:hypothetical protein n=1 Tax=Microtetraspora niveoalba TaxID=46175 RepID=UPI000834B047|nr:hypothetical protein [Microtetraspora niveoalba]
MGRPLSAEDVAAEDVAAEDVAAEDVPAEAEALKDVPAEAEALKDEMAARLPFAPIALAADRAGRAHALPGLLLHPRRRAQADQGGRD